MIKYIKDDLFNCMNAILLHACNCQLNWGRGVAKTMAEYYPIAYQLHKGAGFADVGTVQVIEGERTIVCLFTSKGYGRLTGNYVDPPHKILENTKAALESLGRVYKNRKTHIASPKINAGLFNVPWEKTEALIEQFLKDNPNFEWDVYEK